MNFFSHKKKKTTSLLFEGWYFKHQKENNMIAFIPGTAESGCFVQMIDHNGSRQFSVPSLKVENGIIYAGECIFSKQGIEIHLPGVSGTIRYSSLRPLQSDIMGPFCFFPMECRHGVLSMAHNLHGTLVVDGNTHNFDGGQGYIEKDSGTSFPSSYLWLQCNDFSTPCSIMVSIARIPFAGIHFTGCICAIMFQQKEYRIATYRGVRILSAHPKHIRLCQGKLRLELDIKTTNLGHPLRSPVCGQMSGTIRERNNVFLCARLWDGTKKIFNLKSSHAVYEYFP